MVHACHLNTLGGWGRAAQEFKEEQDYLKEKQTQKHENVPEMVANTFNNTELCS